MGYLILFAFFMAALYFAGLMPARVMHARSFVGNGSWKGRRFGASFTGCGGKIYRVLRVRESRSHSFSLSGHIQQGKVQVVLAKDGAVLLTLDRDNPTGTLPLEKGKGYLLSVCFENASGDYQLEWD